MKEWAGLLAAFWSVAMGKEKKNFTKARHRCRHGPTNAGASKVLGRFEGWLSPKVGQNIYEGGRGCCMSQAEPDLLTFGSPRQHSQTRNSTANPKAARAAISKSAYLLPNSSKQPWAGMAITQQARVMAPGRQNQQRGWQKWNQEKRLARISSYKNQGNVSLPLALWGKMPAGRDVAVEGEAGWGMVDLSYSSAM